MTTPASPVELTRGSSRRPLALSGASAALLALVVAASPPPADAAALTAFAYDPAGTKVYVQFSTDVPFDAWKVVVKRAGAVVGTDGGHPHYSAMGASGEVGGLTPGLNYRLILKIRWVHGGPWVDVTPGSPLIFVAG